MITRRKFVGLSVATGATILAGGKILGSISAPGTATNATFKIGGDLEVNRLGFGAMRLTGEGVWGWPPDRANAVKVLKRTVELGVNLIDTADAYGPEVDELLIAESTASLSEGTPHRDQRREHPAGARSVGAERSPRLSERLR